MIFIYFLLFILGLAVGSFLNVVIYREIQGEKTSRSKKQAKKQWLPAWFWGRSYCDHCKKKIAWYDNIPILSYILLGGRCRYCHQKINLQYPLVELLTAFEFIWIYWLLSRFSFFGRLEGFYSFALVIYWLYIFSSFLVILIADFRGGIIPDWVVFPAILISVLRIFESGRWSLLIWGAAAAAFFLVLYLVTKGKGLGFGDVKLSFLLGLFLGYPQILVAVFLAFLTGAFVAVILVISGKKHFGQTVPFGPFLILGTVVAKFWGAGIWNWYMGLIR
jgi:leader peptidase (prepilin peptidase)/N-methyltransferase